MRNGRLITPIQQMRHCPLVRARSHVCAHTLLTVPGCHRPESPASVSQQCATLESSRFFGLPHRANHMYYKQRNETDRPDSQARQADKGHSSLAVADIASYDEMRPRSMRRPQHPFLCKRWWRATRRKSEPFAPINFSIDKMRLTQKLQLRLVAPRLGNLSSSPRRLAN